MRKLNVKYIVILAIIAFSSFLTTDIGELFIDNGTDYAVFHMESPTNGDDPFLSIQVNPDIDSSGVYIYPNGRTIIGTVDPCNAIFPTDDSIKLIIDGDAWKTGDPFLYGESDRRLKKNIAPLAKRKDKFMDLNFYSYEYEQTGNMRYGIMAQEVKEDFPNSVKTFERNGEEYLAFNPNNLFFTGMKVIQENSKENIEQEAHIQTLETENQQITGELKAEQNRNEQQQKIIEAQDEKIATLEERLTRIEAALSNGTNRTNINRQNIQLDGRGAYLEQNQPNPFDKNTLIRYNVPADAVSAIINIFNDQGQLIHSERIAQMGAGQIQIKAGTITAGTYSYSLVVNGNVVDTKRMVIAK